jgi:hypothetical protein
MSVPTRAGDRCCVQHWHAACCMLRDVHPMLHAACCMVCIPCCMRAAYRTLCALHFMNACSSATFAQRLTMRARRLCTRPAHSPRRTCGRALHSRVRTTACDKHGTTFTEAYGCTQRRALLLLFADGMSRVRVGTSITVRIHVRTYARMRAAVAADVRLVFGRAV